MANKKLKEDITQVEAEEKATPIKRNDDLYNRPINPVPTEPPKIGIDVDQAFYDGLFDKQIFPGKIKGKEGDIKSQLRDLLTIHENKDFDDPNSDEYYRDCFELIKNNCNV